MAARGKRRAAPKKKLTTKLKQDPIGTAKTEVNKTGLFKYVIGAALLGVVGGSQMAGQLRQIPVVGGVLSVAAAKGASLMNGASRGSVSYRSR